MNTHLRISMQASPLALGCRSLPKFPPTAPIMQTERENGLRCNHDPSGLHAKFLERNFQALKSSWVKGRSLLFMVDPDGLRQAGEPVEGLNSFQDRGWPCQRTKLRGWRVGALSQELSAPTPEGRRKTRWRQNSIMWAMIYSITPTYETPLKSLGTQSLTS